MAMRVRLGYLLMMLVMGTYGCQSPSALSGTESSKPEASQGAEEPLKCPTTPSASLTNSQDIDITNTNVEKTGTIRTGDGIGFVFEGKKGQKFKSTANEGICVWTYSPDNSILSKSELPLDGKYTIHIEGLKKEDGALAQYQIALELLDPNLPVATSSGSPNTARLTSQDDAVKVAILETIENYMEAKPRIFARPFDRDIVRQLTTDKKYVENISSIDWLQANNSYYTYDVIRIDNSWDFFNNSDTATINLSITQDLTLYSNGKIDPTNTTYGAKQRDYRFTMRKVGSNWKISQVEDLF